MLLPVHNTSATLGAALDSLLAQSLPDFEVVTLDDGSSDNTLALLQAYAQREARVRPLPQVLLHWRDEPARATRTDARYAVENFLRAEAHYLLAGPLHNRERVIMWGAGQMARCLAKHLQRAGGGIFGSEPAKVQNATARRADTAHDNSACCMEPTRSS